MKKIFLLFAAACALVACDPTSEDISGGGHITVEELLAKTSVTTDMSTDGKHGNILTCKTSAPVSASWNIAGKNIAGNYAQKKMRVGDFTVTLTGICGDGTIVKADIPVSIETETDPIKKFWIYGQDPAKQPEFWLESGDAGAGRFSDNEGKYFPYLSDDIYNGLKTLVFEVTDTQEGQFIWAPDPQGTDDMGLTMRVMNGWWSSVYAENVVPTKGYWELDITKQMADECAPGAGARDLDLLMTRGKIKIRACYYEY